MAVDMANGVECWSHSIDPPGQGLLSYGRNYHAHSENSLKNKENRKESEPQIIPRASHNLSRDEISKSALKVLYRLHKSGFQAFLVGGSVRDALLGLHPKDFDIATDALPEEVNALFANCRLIGRRFRLAHVRFGREVIEVATFRAAATQHDSREHSSHDVEGRILRDNVYGSIHEDVWRRDFTCNALYYNIADFSIWDYVGGVEDVRNRRLVFIGDPVQRIREDPVRMLRAARFAAKLDFEIDESVASAMEGLVDLLQNVPPARLFDEFLKMFQSGHAEKTFATLWQHHLFGQLFPETDRELEKSQQFGNFVRAALVNTDRRVAAGKSVGRRRRCLKRSPSASPLTRSPVGSSRASLSRVASPRPCARCLRCSRASKSAKARGRWVCSSTGGFVQPTIS
jgi:poly(A) polymerase